MHRKVDALLGTPRSLLALCLCALACSETGGDGNGDGGLHSEATVTASCPAGVDRSVNVDTAIALQPNEEVQDYICPRRDKDFYAIEVPAGQRLLHIKLQHGNPISQLNLTYVLLRDEGSGNEPSVAGRAPDGKNNRYDTLHCLGPGKYYIQVQDAGDDAIDNKSQYRLSYTLESDQEGLDGDDEPATAKPLSGSASGTISCNGDTDYYVVRNVGANQLLQLSLTTTQTTTVDYKYTVLRPVGDSYEPLLTDAHDDGSREPTAMEIIAAVPGAGDYYVRVEDLDGNDSDASLIEATHYS